MTESLLRLKITGKLAYEDDITVVQAAKVIGFLNGAARDDGSPDDLDDGEERKRDTRRVASPRDALSVSGAKTNPEKIVALAAYVLQDGGETFKSEAIKVQFQRAREALPGNLARDLSTAITAGWVAESETAGEYYLTHKIENVLVDGFPQGAGRSSTRSKSSGSSAKKKTKALSKPDVFSSIDDFPVQIGDLPSYHKMKHNKDKLLWVLAFAKSRQIPGLANSDIAWLTDHLGDGVPVKQITSTFDSAKRQGYATRSTMDNTIKIRAEGEEYLAGLKSKA